MHRLLHALFCAILLLAAVPALAGYANAPIALAVTIANPAQHIMHTTEQIPVTPGPLTLYYPKYIPGEHGPTGPIVNVAGLTFTANGERIAWRRDPIDMYTFHIAVPDGADTLTVNFDFLSPAAGGIFTAGVSMTPKLVDLEWNQVALYPAGLPTSKLSFRPSVTLPRGWKYATALTTKNTDGNNVNFALVSFNNLVDSPLIAGEHFRQVNLAPHGNVPHHLDMVADYPEALAVGPYLGNFRKLVEQANRLFGSHHYKHYDFLLTLSDYTAHFGLEHHQSSDDRVNANLFLDKQTMFGEASFLPHEYVHSWNGKFRRPAKLWQPDFEQPEQTALLWVYEGLTNYWGEVLAARAGFWSPADYREMFAYNAAYMAHRPGRAWRSLLDVTTAAQLLYGSPGSYSNWRRGVDFYDEGPLIWLGVDAKIRALTHGKRSLDDFAKRFYGMNNGSYVTVTYTFEDLTAALNEVAPYDWSSYLADLVRKPHDKPPLGGIAASGWRLVYTTTPNPYEQAREAIHDFIYATCSIGLRVSNKGRIEDVLWNGPAFKAGLAPGMTIIGVNGNEFDEDVLRRAIAATAKSDKGTIKLAIKGEGVVRNYTIKYAGGLRYPHLERITDTPDYLDKILAPVKSGK